MFSFGTPAKSNQYATQYMDSAGRSVHFAQSPQEMGASPIEAKMTKSASQGDMLYASYPCKTPNSRLIDIKNATWRTKNQMWHHGRHLGNKMLYTVGPREAYVVDKTFDREMNFLQLGQLSHEGELLAKKREAREYTVSMDNGYNNEHKDSKSKVTPEMRAQLYEDMGKEHEEVVSSPTKYPRKYQ
jgi:hypothetical protein